jgi:hypothetical protein
MQLSNYPWIIKCVLNYSPSNQSLNPLDLSLIKCSNDTRVIRMSIGNFHWTLKVINFHYRFCNEWKALSLIFMILEFQVSLRWKIKRFEVDWRILSCRSRAVTQTINYFRTLRIREFWPWPDFKATLYERFFPNVLLFFLGSDRDYNRLMTHAIVSIFPLSLGETKKRTSERFLFHEWCEVNWIFIFLETSDLERGSECRDKNQIYDQNDIIIFCLWQHQSNYLCVLSQKCFEKFHVNRTREKHFFK